MRVPRIYQAVDLVEGQEVVLDRLASQYIGKVLRLKKHHAIVLFNGSGDEYHGVVSAVDRRSVVIDLQTCQQKNLESGLKITLGQCISRGDRMDYAIQKSVELGVVDIVPLESERGGVQLSAERMEKRRLHWQRVAISACEQCGRNIVPSVLPVKTISDWLTQPNTAMSFLLAPKAEHLPLPDLLPADSDIRLLIGPEGGLTTEEVQTADAANFHPLNLGPRILRTETAAVVAITVMQTLWGDILKG